MNTKEFLAEHKSLLIGKWLPDLANTSAFVFQNFKDLNWAGFYLLNGDLLELGPFQGLPACTEIAVGKGVCGTAAHERRTIVVADVHQFPGHIACDARSQSELVVPMIAQNNELIGVLDLDSASKNRFSSTDAELMQQLVTQLLARNFLSHK